MDTDIDTLLKAWGRLYQERPRIEYGERRQRPEHPIARSMEFAPGKKVKRSTVALGRDGRGRRRIMAAAVGLKGLTVVPMAYVDPVPCKETRSNTYGIHSRPVPKEIQRVEQAVKELEQVDYLRALCLRINYCREGRHDEKAKQATDQIREVNRDHKAVTVSDFRDELMYGRIWLHGRLYAAETAA